MIYESRQFSVDVEKKVSETGLSPLISRLVSQRNIDSIDSFFNIDLGSHHNLKNEALISGLSDAASFLNSCLVSKKNIAVIGDYDVDGIISSYMIKRLCELYGSQCNVFLPSRFEHGYGLNEHTLAAFFAFTIVNQIPDVLIIVDCGSSSEKEINRLKNYGIKHVIVVDHHIINNDLFSKSADFVINWRLGGNEMCSCGLMYLIALQIFNKKTLKEGDFGLEEFLALAALGTVADVSPIIDDNRVIVKNGLKFFNKISSKGLRSLISYSGIKEGVAITQQQVGFKIAPRLNAVGRLGSPQESFDLLVSDDTEEINRIVKSIESTNKQRQQIQGDILEEAIAMVDESKMEYGIFLVNPNWNIGVVGVVASEIVKRFNKPTVVIGKEKSIWKGSGRSVKGISLIKILSLCSKMFDKYGGHDYAAGVTLNKECVHAVVQEFNAACKKILDDENQNSNKVLFYDAVLKPSTINLDTYNSLLHLYPYCETNNPEPVFRLTGVSPKVVKTIENDNWTLFIFSVEGITECEFKTFDSEFSNCLNYGNKVNLYFKFPQNFDDRWKMSLEVVGVEVLEI